MLQVPGDLVVVHPLVAVSNVPLEEVHRLGERIRVQRSQRLQFQKIRSALQIGHIPQHELDAVPQGVQILFGLAENALADKNVRWARGVSRDPQAEGVDPINDLETIITKLISQTKLKLLDFSKG